MKIMAIIAALIVCALAAVAVWVRLAPSDPTVWHVDPLTATGANPKASFLMRAGGDAPALVVALPPDAAAARLDAIALATPRTVRLSGEGGFVTYVTRSALWGFPDYTSVRISPVEGGSEVAVYARSRFGDGDFGVNKARVQAWIAQLQS